MKSARIQSAGLLVLVLFLFGSSRASDPGASAGGNLGIGANFRLYPSTTTQTETFIVRHPHDPTILFASANTIVLSTGFISEGIYVSTDAGTTWSGNDTCNGAILTFHRGDPGIAIDRNGRFILIRLGNTPGLYSHYSTDNGETWSSQRTIAMGDQDRATLASDGNPGSPYYGRSYAVWVQFSLPYPLLFSYSDDGAANWITPAQINNPPPQRCVGGEVAIATDGTVIVCWAGALPASPFTEDYAGFASSTDGGISWTVLQNAFDMNGIMGTFPQKANIRVNGLPRIAIDNSGGSRDGWIYIVSGEKNIAPAGSDADILLHRSTNGGLTWSAGVRVNQDAVNNGKLQYFPAIHVDGGGGVNALYYDDRNTTSDSAAVFLSRSTDGGVTWDDYQVSDHTFQPLPIGGLGQGYQGDNIGMTSVGDTLWPVWMDNSTGIYQIWTCPIDLSDLGTSVDEEPGLPLTTGLMQNYPNPFNAETEIRFRITDYGFVRLEVADVLGREVATLVNEKLGPGTYRRHWSAQGLPSGVYFYKLKTEGFTESKKMLYLR